MLPTMDPEIVSRLRGMRTTASVDADLYRRLRRHVDVTLLEENAAALEAAVEFIEMHNRHRSPDRDRLNAALVALVEVRLIIGHATSCQCGRCVCGAAAGLAAEAHAALNVIDRALGGK